MSDTTKSDFQEFLEDCGDDLNFTCRSYSGRSMYGRDCIGIDCDDALNLLAKIAFRAGETDMEGFPEARTDSMGRGSILYFPKEKYLAEEPALCEHCAERLCNHCGACHAEDCPERVEQSSDDCDGEGPNA